MTDVGIELLAAGCPNLNWLDLDTCTQVTDAGIERLAAGCPNLMVLDLSFVSRVTGVGIDRIAAGCHNFRTLYMEEDSPLEDAALALGIHITYW